MNRKLHAPIFACTASAAALVVGLLVAWPAASSEDTGIEAHTVPTPPPAGDIRMRPATGAGASDAASLPAPRSRSKRARSAIAMPYFSFARGAGGRS